MTTDDYTGDSGSRRGAGFAIPTSVLAAIEGVLNQYIALDPAGARALEPTYGRIIAIVIEGLDAHLTLIPGPDRVQVFGTYDATPDCLISGPPLALLHLLTAPRKESQLSIGTVRIEGDTAVAQALSEALAGLDVDWEEQLAKVLGDPIANQLGRALRATRDWGGRTGEGLRANVKEYLEEESRLLPTRYEVDEFLRQVDTLRDDGERLAVRIARLAALADALDAERGDPR